jgi:hypothetical protein
MEHMEDYGEAPAYRPAPLPTPGRRWLLLGGLALAFMLMLGVGVLVGSAIGGARAASFFPAGVNNGQALAFGPGAQGRAFDPAARGAPGQCAVLTVSSVSGRTIVAKAPDGTAVTIHTTASTQYTKAGQSAAASAVTVGSQIHVDGTHNSDGSITATRIDIAG